MWKDARSCQARLQVAEGHQNALYYRVRYLQEKNRKLEGRVQEFKKTELQSSNDLLDHAGRSQ